MVGGGDNKIKNCSQNDRKNTLNLSFGVFFDGTLNSIANIDERKDFQKFLSNTDFLTLLGNIDVLTTRNQKILCEDSSYDSYRNEYTNVARFYKCFKNEDSIIPIYVEGIGTKPREIGKKINFTEAPPIENGSYSNYTSLNKFIEDNDGFVTCSDDTVGSALGVGMFGVKKKVEAACEKIFYEIKKYDLRKYNELKLDLYVFGFSRGSAAARCFSSCLQRRLGKTKVDSSFNTNTIGILNVTSIKKKLAQENRYRTSLKMDWLDFYFNNPFVCNPIKGVNSIVKVKFLGLYDTVSSYGVYFDDDVDELSLKINAQNVENVYQICAGDEYRKNFALTNISSAGGKEKYIIIPGAHSDVGGGYAHNIKEGLKSFLGFSNSIVGISSGHKGKKMLIDEGWFKSGESERTISNLYSIIPFLLMKEKIVGRNEVFISEILNKYVLPSSTKGLKIDGIKHEYNKALCDFYNKLKAGKYDAYYRIEGSTIKNLSKEEHDLSNYLSQMNSLIPYLKTEDVSNDVIKTLENDYKEKKNKLRDVKQKKVNYDEALLRKIRHDFLHLSAKSKDLTDPFVNGSDNNNNRTVING